MEAEAEVEVGPRKRGAVETVETTEMWWVRCRLSRAGTCCYLSHACYTPSGVSDHFGSVLCGVEGSEGRSQSRVVCLQCTRLFVFLVRRFLGKH